MKQLTRLFIPICLETLFYMLSGMVDTLMLSAVGDYAVGAVGTANSYIGIFIIMFSIISSGMVSVMTQNIGAGRPGVAYQARQLGLLFNAVAGVLMAVFLFSGAGAILRMVGIADALYEPALIYLKIVGGGCILNAVIPIFSSYLRAFGYTKQPLYATIVGNIANFVMNAVFLFVLHKGVAGVATATVISKILNLCIVLYFSHKLISAKNSTERIANKTVLGQIVKVGLPSACETALYNVAMMLVIRFLNQMDAEGLNVTARSYTATISNFSYCVGAALAQANAIMTGWHIGAGELEECDRGTKRAAFVGVCVAVCMETAIVLGSGFIMPLFTDNPEMTALVRKLLAIDIVLEIGRVTNLVFGQALKTSGDAVFPAVIAAVFMFVFAVGGTWLFGISMGLMAVERISVLQVTSVCGLSAWYGAGKPGSGEQRSLCEQEEYQQKTKNQLREIHIYVNVVHFHKIFTKN